MLLITKVKSELRLLFGIFEYPLILVPHTLLFCVCLLGGTPDDAIILALCSRFASGSALGALWCWGWNLGLLCVKPAFSSLSHALAPEGYDLSEEEMQRWTVMRPTAQTMLWANIGKLAASMTAPPLAPQFRASSTEKVPHQWQMRDWSRKSPKCIFDKTGLILW